MTAECPANDSCCLWEELSTGIVRLLISEHCLQSKVKAVKRRQLYHMLYTQPPAVTAGSTVTLFYNAANTSLREAQRIFVRGGWNRWTHPKKLGPLELLPPKVRPVSAPKCTRV